jgi:hypothetical protein
VTPWGATIYPLLWNHALKKNVVPVARVVTTVVAHAPPVTVPPRALLHVALLVLLRPRPTAATNPLKRSALMLKKLPLSASAR